MAYYKKKELIGEDIVTPSGSKTCIHCNIRIKKRETVVAFKFFSKTSVYTHHNCKNKFKESLT